MNRFWLLLFPAPFLIAATPPLSDVLSSNVDTSAAERFAKVWHETGGKPDAEVLARDYLMPKDRGIEIFTPGRIVSADHLASTIAEKSDLYRDAVERCLPWAMDQDSTFRAVNLGLRGLLPDRTPPAVAVVVGGDNSGGTAGPGMQVIGLEVICRLSPDRVGFDRRMRGFFAHEAVHTFQDIEGPKTEKDWLMSQVIVEGTADYISSLVTGLDPNPERNAWARERGDALWEDLAHDRATSVAHATAPGDFDKEGARAVRRWVMNAGSPPDGWPDELGYWAGAQIARAYVEASPDPATALNDLLRFDDPAPIIERAATRNPALRPLLNR